MVGMARRGRYPAEVRERAVRMVFEHEREYESQWAAITSIAAKLGMTNETLRKWVRQAEIDGGARSGVSSVEAERVKALERENRELRRANEILKAASIFFARELDRNRRSDERVYRRAPRCVRGRADLQRVAVRPIDVLRGLRTPAQAGGADAARRRVAGGDPTRL